MLNTTLGTPGTIDGRTYLTTSAGERGHAIYGDYDFLEAGNYLVEFNLQLAGEAPKRDMCVAVLDVVVDAGRTVIASKKIMLSQLRGGRSAFTIPYTLQTAARTEHRVAVTGRAPLVIDGYRPNVRLTDEQPSGDPLQAVRFPGAEGEAVAYFREHRDELQSLHERGIGVRIVRDRVVLTVNGLSLFAAVRDDMRFIGEVFFESVYNFTSGGEVCVIDIGMNIGLSSLLFASKPEVVEVHSFEPFANTFDRAVDNISLNPALAPKIDPRNHGLSDRDEEREVIVAQMEDSGAMSTVGAASGVAVAVSLKDAGAELQPIVDRCHAAGRRVIVKVDCEGSEFAIFAALDARGLLPKITAFMVEWHAMFADKAQEDLIAPLRRNGFVVFDRSPPIGNGFFYAVRSA